MAAVRPSTLYFRHLLCDVKAVCCTSGGEKSCECKNTCFEVAISLSFFCYNLSLRVGLGEYHFLSENYKKVGCTYILSVMCTYFECDVYLLSVWSVINVCVLILSEWRAVFSDVWCYGSTVSEGLRKR